MREKHPDKTFAGRIGHGRDLPGCHFTADSLTLAEGILFNFAGTVSRLYEREREGSSILSLPGSYAGR